MAAKPVLVLSSDWHLSILSWKKHPNIARDSYYSLSQIVDLAIELNVPLIGAGDLFDKKLPPSESVIHCCNEMKRLAQAGLNMFYVQGQHEMEHKPWLSLCDNAVHLRSFGHGTGVKYFDIQGLKVCGMDIEFNPEVFNIKLKELHSDALREKHDLFVTHQVWGDFVKKSVEPYLLKNATFAKVLYTGDFHGSAVLNIDGTTCVSSGSINMQANNEPPYKTVFVLYDDLSLKEVDIKTRPFIHFEVKNDEALKYVMDTDKTELLKQWKHKNLPTEIRTPLIVIKYQNDIPNAYASLEEKFRDWNYELNGLDFSSTEMTMAADRAELRTLIDISDCVSQFVPPDSVTHSDAVRVFNSSDVESELKSMRKEHLEKGVSHVS
jgi:hypothetical protein